MLIRFLGAVGTVTGSCVYIECNQTRLLIDCGMHQGYGSDELNRAPFEFRPSDLDYLLLTHAHIDHSGLVPRLVKEGFKGNILCTPATSELLMIMLKDSAHLQEKDAEWHNKKERRAGGDRVFTPLYYLSDVEAIIPFIRPIQYSVLEHLGAGLMCKFLDAGHILGSASIELWYQDRQRQKRVVFSGDIGKHDNPIVRDPKPPEDADYVIIESTYGNRLHRGKQESLNEFVEVLNETFKRGGNVMIPSFAVGRTQDLLFILNILSGNGAIKYPFKTFVDSPLAKEATDIYLKHPECFDDETLRILRAGRRLFGNVYFTSSVEDSQAINKIQSGAVIIAGSGMCEGGRIGHHFKHNLWRKECSLIFVGYQASGTLGRRIIDGAKIVKILGEDIAVKASVHTIGGFSAHADRQGLLDWLRAIKNRPKVFVNHGEQDISRAFCDTITDELSLEALCPQRYKVFSL